MLTILAEAALENEQIDKAMEAMGIAQNLKKGENVVVARGGGPKSVHTGLGRAARQGLLAENSKTKVRYLGSRLTRKDVNHKCNIFKACALLQELFSLEACQRKLARRLLAMTRRIWDSEPKQQQIWTKSLGLFKKNGRAKSEGRPFPPASTGSNLGANTNG